MSYRLYLQGGQLVTNCVDVDESVAVAILIKIAAACQEYSWDPIIKCAPVFCHMLTFSSLKVFSSFFKRKLQQMFRIAASYAKHANYTNFFIHSKNNGQIHIEHAKCCYGNVEIYQPTIAIISMCKIAKGKSENDRLSMC
ncbi:hypothetical protein T10_4427 [Trichinella papuae]|uniref:Uncharacterized protein n=1 Tax=Trichinella papuae TaxID=268474 RepID=A0A0V1N093_9BILA|nr:hypothetical protein T10_4427 [Trichinella papuae]